MTHNLTLPYVLVLLLGGPVSTVRGYCDPEVPPDARRAAEAAGAQAKYEAYKEGVTAGSCLSRGVAPPGAGPA